MSCDANRARLFGVLASTVAPLVGDVAAGRELLDTLYEVVSNQDVPPDAVARLAGEARTRQMLRYARGYEIELYPHPSSDGLPAPEAQQGWRAVAEVIEAVDRGTALPLVARDVQQSLAFRSVTRRGQSRRGDASRWDTAFWEASISGAARLAVRRMWAASPALVAALRTDPDSFGDEALAPWLRGLAERLAADARLDPALAAAARQYLVLDEEGMLAPEERAVWAQVVAEVAGVGVGPGGDSSRFVCQCCGRWSERGNHHCTAADAAVATEVAMAVAELLADPLLSDTAPDPSPLVTGERLLTDWMQRGEPDPPEGAVGRLLAAMRAADQQMLRQISRRSGMYGPIRRALIDKQWLRDATIRTPLVFEGERYIWEGDFLYPADAYRQHARWGERGESDLLFPGRLHNATMLAVFDADRAVSLMLGRPVAHFAMKFPRPALPQRYTAVPVRRSKLRQDDLVYYPECGCLYVCKVRATTKLIGELHRIEKPAGGCAVHHDSSSFFPEDRSPVLRVDLTRPRFELPIWPNMITEPEASDEL